MDAANVAHLSRRSAVISERPWLLFFDGDERPWTPAAEQTRVKVAAMMVSTSRRRPGRSSVARDET